MLSRVWLWIWRALGNRLRLEKKNLFGGFLVLWITGGFTNVPIKWKIDYGYFYGVNNRCKTDCFSLPMTFLGHSCSEGEFWRLVVVDLSINYRGLPIEANRVAKTLCDLG